jgi:hypothetical protein
VRYAAFKEMADLGPGASNAFNLPIFEIPILEDEKKSPCSSSDFVTWWLCLPTVNKMPDNVINKSANQTANLQCSGDSKATTCVCQNVVSGGTQISHDLSQGSMSAFFVTSSVTI